MRAPWWLAVPVFLAVIFHQTLFTFVDDDISYFVGTVQASCSMRLLQRENCDRGREYIRQSFMEVGERKFTVSEAVPYRIYHRMRTAIDSYSPLMSFLHAPFNVAYVAYSRWGGMNSRDGLRYYQIYTWLYRNGWWLALYCVAVWLVASAVGGQWLRALVILNGSLVIIGALDLFSTVGYFTFAYPRMMIIVFVVAGLLRRGALEERTCQSKQWDIPSWGLLLLGALTHPKAFDIFVPPLFAVMILYLGRGQALWQRALHSGIGLAVLVGIGEIAVRWMNLEVYAMGLARDLRNLPVDAPLPLFRLESFVPNIWGNVRALNNKAGFLNFFVFSIALSIVCRARINARTRWTRGETIAVITLAAWPLLVSFIEAGGMVREPFRRAFLGVALFAVVATALADSSLMPWVSWQDTDAGVAKIRIEGMLQGLCIGLVSWWLISLISHLTHVLRISPWDTASLFLDTPSEGRVLRYVQLVLGLP